DAWHALYDAYLADVRKANPDPAKNPATILAVGDALFQSGDYASALALYKRAPSRGKEATAAQNRIALTLARTERQRDAELMLTGMVNNGEANDATHAILGIVYLQQRKFAKARAEVEGPMQHRSLSALIVAAHADIALRDFRRGLEELKQVAERADLPETY